MVLYRPHPSHNGLLHMPTQPYVESRFLSEEEQQCLTSRSHSQRGLIPYHEITISKAYAVGLDESTWMVLYLSASVQSLMWL